MNGFELAIIEAAQRVCKSISEEDVHAMSEHLPEENQTEFVAAMTDLGQAVQEYES